MAEKSGPKGQPMPSSIKDTSIKTVSFLPVCPLAPFLKTTHSTKIPNTTPPTLIKRVKRSSLSYSSTRSSSSLSNKFIDSPLQKYFTSTLENKRFKSQASDSLNSSPERYSSPLSNFHNLKIIQ